MFILVCWRNSTPFLCKEVLGLNKIYDFKADYQNEKAVKLRRSTNADGKSLNEENLEKINWEPLDQDIHDELKKDEVFQSYKQLRMWNNAHIVAKRFQVILQKLMKMLFSLQYLKRTQNCWRLRPCEW